MLSTILKKEFLLLSRDIHALMVLFVMPAAFILIMSLSLQDKFEEKPLEKLKLGIAFENIRDKEDKLGQRFTQIDGYQILFLNAKDNYKTISEKESLAAIITIPANFLEKFAADETLTIPDRIALSYTPTTPDSLRKLVHASVSRILAAYQVEEVLASYINDPKEREKEKAQFLGDSLLIEKNIYSHKNKQPTSVEQTVPAWLIFAMFFVVIPLSTTFIIEKQQGTLQRLKTLPTPQSYFLIGKLVPYIIINIIQMILMFLVGIFILPLLGGQGIHLHSNAWLLLPMSLAVSFAAVSFALLIASLVKTTEQATTIGGVSNLIFAAIGGIMVPTFVMPKVMQNVASLSPMNWGLEGYLDIILRQGGFVDILPEVGKLIILGLLLFALTSFVYKK